jgi:lipopolysaccharide transport system permease protein
LSESGFFPHSHLLWALVRRELAVRYRGSVLGFAWTLLTPLLMLGVYALVFGQILKVRWSPNGTEPVGEFATYLFCGLLIFNFFADCIGRAPALITGNANYVKKVVFPLQLLPLASVIASAVHLLIATFVLLVFEMFALGHVPTTALLFPLCVLPVLGYALGGAWFLAALGPYLRDIQHLVGPALSVLMLLSPIFYPSTMIPERWRPLLAYDPLTLPIEHARAVLVTGALPDIGPWLLSLVAAIVVAGLGYTWFAKTRSGFADVL